MTITTTAPHILADISTAIATEQRRIRRLTSERKTAPEGTARRLVSMKLDSAKRRRAGLLRHYKRASRPTLAA